MAKLWKFGYPTGIEMSLNIVAFTFIVMMFHGQGIVAATATTIVFNWDMVAFVPILGFEIGVTSLVGRYLGAGKPDLSHRSVMSGLKLGLIYSAVIMFFFIIFPHLFVNVFQPQTANETFALAMPLAVSMIKLIPFYISAVVVMIVYVGALRGAGDTFWAMLITTSIHWFIAVATYIAVYGMKSSTFSAWITLVGSFLVICWLPYFRYRQGNWKKIRLVDPAAPLIISDAFHEPRDL